MDKITLCIHREYSKTFGKVVANNNINLTIYGGEIHALLVKMGQEKVH